MSPDGSLTPPSFRGERFFRLGLAKGADSLPVGVATCPTKVVISSSSPVESSPCSKEINLATIGSTGRGLEGVVRGVSVWLSIKLTSDWSINSLPETGDE
jgi:hypothetical protein